MYIGGVDRIDRMVWILDSGGEKVIRKNIHYSPGLFKIFDELMVNVYDQTIRDPTLRTIRVVINETTNEITIFNDGIGLDVVVHPEELIYVPELIFGHLLTSTSFDDDMVRTTGGIHGLGAKLTAIFSTKFKIDIGDPVNRKRFRQVYRKNLSKRSKPIVDEYKPTNGYVRITYIPDMKYFKIDRLDSDMIALMRRRVVDIAAITRENVRVFINDVRINVKTLGNYVKMYTDDTQFAIACEKDSIRYEDDRWKLIITQSHGEFEQISFVNGINTMDGGYHVNYIADQIVRRIKEYVRLKYKTDRIKDRFIRNQLRVFVSAVIENPTFASQTKNELMTPVDKFGSTCIVSERALKKFYTSEPFERMIGQQIDLVEKQEFGKTTVRRKSNIVSIPKLYDANYAGTSRSSECKLILTEGDSAKTMAVSGLSAIPRSSNIYGVFPLKGKLINVRDQSHRRIIQNTEFINLKNIMGLKIDRQYTADQIDELRYGSIILMMDADVDGSHIKGLFINMMHYYWPSLLEINGFIKIFITPIVKVTHKNEINIFYNNDDYVKWKNKNNSNIWKIKYYKGLGTNTAEEAKEYFKNLDQHQIDMVWDERSNGAIELGFSKAFAYDRKKWLMRYDPSDQNDHLKHTLTYYNFIHRELIHFSNYDNVRSIPNIIDGLKPSQRKVLYAAFKKDLRNEIKVAQFVGYIGEHTAYHHGEISLSNTIIAMAQNFVGSNNINLFEPLGQFGTRLLGGRDHASPRYIFTRLNHITRYIFRKEDDDLLEYLDDEGIGIEPKFFIPIIPMILVNGAEGIGTGYSTYIPKFNPLDIIQVIRNKLQTAKVSPSIKPKPWYRGFTGEINTVSKNVYMSKGVFERDRNKVIIKELPIGTWTDRYREHLTKLANENEHIREIRHNSTDQTVDVSIRFDNTQTIDEMMADPTNIERLFGLTTTINQTNMHGYDEKMRIRKYKNIREIVDNFFNVRIYYYEVRKKYILDKLKHQLQIIESKVRFIQSIIDGTIVVMNRPYDDLVRTLHHNMFYKLTDEEPFDYLTNISIRQMTSEKINEFQYQLKEKKNTYKELRKKSINLMWLDELDCLERMISQ